MSYHMMSMEIMSNNKMSQNIMPMMDHSNHKMMSESSDTDASCSEDCCGKSCGCFTSGCSNLATIMKNSVNTPPIDSSSKIPSYLSLAVSQQPTSLYRPPILS